MRRCAFLLLILVAALSAWLASAPAFAQTGPAGASTPEGQNPSSHGQVPEAPSGGTLTLPAAEGDGAPAVPAVASAPLAAGLAGRPSVTAERTDTAPDIDGRLDDPVWRTATRVSEFVQQRPVEGAPATEQTEVYIGFDSQRIYFGIYAHYSNPGLVRANRVDRDRTRNDDTVTVYVDTFFDQQRGYSFSVNGYGVQADALLRGPGGPGGGGGGRGGWGGGGGDDSWDALFASAGTLVEDGWTAEMAIPFKSLRYPARGRGVPHRWGFQIERSIESKDETVVWAPVSRGVMGFLRQMGTLEGLVDLSTSRNLELLPTFTAIDVGALDRTSGVYARQDTEEGGLNVKYGITSNLTFDFTYNPDFSQIESDRQQIEVNQRFPVFYPELRPFFLEGQDIFTVPGPVNFIHTRTIVDPRMGAKLTGKIGKMTMGVLVADDEAPGRIDDESDPAFGRSAQFLIARARYDVYPDSGIGFLLTDREFLDSSSRLVGIDMGFQLGATHRTAYKAFTTQYRDQNGVERTGEMFEANFRKQGRNLSYRIAHNIVEPDFTTDVGFVRRTDMRQTTANVNYRWWPEGWILSWGPRLNLERNYDHDDALQDDSASLGVNFDFARSIGVNADYNREMERYRGVDFWKSSYSIGGNVSTSRRISFGGNFRRGDQIRFVADPFLGRSGGHNLNVNLRPFSRLQSSFNLNTSRFVDPRTESEVFNVKILRSQTTYQFTERLLVRNITEYNTFDRTVAANLLVTYRVNAGTVFYVGYDDRYRQGNQIDGVLFPTDAWQRTNRAMFTKLQYLFRY